MIDQPPMTPEQIREAGFEPHTEGDWPPDRVTETPLAYEILRRNGTIDCAGDVTDSFWTAIELHRRGVVGYRLACPYARDENAAKDAERRSMEKPSATLHRRPAMTVIAAIAARLTKAQRVALRLHSPFYGCRTLGWPGSPTRHEHSFGKSGRPMMDAGLIAWPRNPRNSQTVLTPLGLSVRQHLQENER